MAPHQFFGQLGVAGEAERGPAPLLDLPRPHHARADGGAGLGPAGEGEQLLRRQTRDGDLEVDAVKDGAGELAPVPVQLRGGADALLHGVAREPAGAGVGRQDQQDPGGVGDGPGRAAHDDLSVLQRRPQALRQVAPELRKLVQKKNAPMLPDGRVQPLPGTRSLTVILSGNTSIRSTNVR